MTSELQPINQSEKRTVNVLSLGAGVPGFDEVRVVPEPSAILLLLAGCIIAGIALIVRHWHDTDDSHRDTSDKFWNEN